MDTPDYNRGYGVGFHHGAIVMVLLVAVACVIIFGFA